jgi:hypothetical protein
MIRSKSICVSFLLLLATSRVSDAQSAHEIDMGRCENAGVAIHSSIQTLEFESTDRVGHRRRVEATLTWQRRNDGLSRAVVRIHKPSDLNGAGVLLIEKKAASPDMFIYLPELKRVKRVTTRMLSGSMFGSDFSYEDFMQLQGISVEGRTERLEDAIFDGRAVYVVAHYPSLDSGSAYQRVIGFWDAELCIPLKTEMWESGERLRKELNIDRSSLQTLEGVSFPQQLSIRDLRDKTSTSLSVKVNETNVEINRSIFSTSSLERSGRR